ncbi:uncharacterized protein SPPG_08825 [Spizellomyces punctatus DAOM BR117]|uniref:SPIN90/Ldb17 leucine-rich domain-containing protein n=1 Tax=Spizellomyces punctatus (strain DAOM BR117) TaxID=645134 RepID=A0A0L0HUG0_SPIPD|nr:uncharacterized protein SPPG_08825 [Spizellomyces punctatus DAOM BR117]KND04535.1 hypothetical protein SPPG_08825 [Spizellomyces punctatus DAOM BR117]|eukprot:XP_016612574.1 hypothetical protein SPPG_08825 [Spizellomyces punctatus DAOM BR117]
MNGEEQAIYCESLVKRVDRLLEDKDTPFADVVQGVIKCLQPAVPYLSTRNIQLLCAQVLSGRLEDDPDEVVDLLGNYENSEDDAAYIVYSLLHHLGHAWPNAFRRLDDEWLARLKTVLLKRSGERCHQMAALLMCEICETRELSLSDLETFDASFLNNLAEMIEQTGSAENEEENYTLVRALLAIHDQFAQKNFARSVIPNRVIEVLQKRIDQSKTLSENFIFIFNREEDRKRRIIMARFLEIVLSSTSARNLWYTNDLGIILDVVIRETNNVDAEDEMLHHSYIRLLPLLLRHPNVTWSERRKQEVEKQLVGIRDGPFVKSSTRKCAERALMDILRP